MRLPLLCAALTLTVACAPDPVPNPPPSGQFYFPTGIAFHQGSGDAGTLFVASSNFDKRFDRGLLSRVQLGELPTLPAIGDASFGGAPLVINELGAISEVEIQSFAGELALLSTEKGPRVFVASRAEQSPLQFIDSSPSGLACPYASADKPKDCFTNAPSLTEAENTRAGIPRAPAPSGLYVTQGTDAEIFIAHFQSADSPRGSANTDQNKLRESYIVRTSAIEPNIVESTTGDGASFIPIGVAGTSSLVATPRWIIASGRFLSDTGGPLIRLVDRSNPGRVLNAGLEGAFHSVEARGLAVTFADAAVDDRTIFLAARQPDVLLVAKMTGGNGDSPLIRVVKEVQLPSNPNDVKLIERQGAVAGTTREPLVVITCSGDDSVVIYDAEVGAVISRLSGVGDQPFSLAIQRLGTAARLFVSNFADGRVAVIDIADVARPTPRIVGHIGRNQVCITTTSKRCQP